MALNPVAYTEKVISNFLRYQLTAYPFADPGLHEQMRRLLSLEETRRTPLMKGPYVSLSRPFVEGASVEQLVSEGILHEHMRNLIPHPHLYGHQEHAVRSIVDGKPTIVSTGTGSGKTECFLYPIISKCLQLRDEDAPAGIVAVIIYPMNALAEDQLGRLRSLLAGTGITFGMYVGHTPDTEGEVTGEKLPPGSSKAEYLAAVAKIEAEGKAVAVHPPEERCSRARMRTEGEQPRILLTNIKQMELLLTRGVDVPLFDNARLDFLVFDEAHTFRGAEGAETACLIRRLRAFCGRDPKETVCIATSATIADPKRKDDPRSDGDPAREFACRFFGVEADDVNVVHEKYEPNVSARNRVLTPAPQGDISALLQETLAAVDAGADAGRRVARVCKALIRRSIDPARWEDDLFRVLAETEMVHCLQEVLKKPEPMDELVEMLGRRLKREVTEEEVLIWLALGAAARDGERPLLRPVVHVFVRGVGGAVVTFPTGQDTPKLYLSSRQEEAQSTDVQMRPLPVLTCTTCGQHYFEHHLQDFEFTDKQPGGGELVGDRRHWLPLGENQGGCRALLLDHLIGAEDDDDDPARTAEVYLCRYCGAVHPGMLDRCDGCGRHAPLVRLLAIQHSKPKEDQPAAPPGTLTRCLSCGATGGPRNGRYREPIRPVRATVVSDVHVLAQEMIRHSERPRLLVFADNRQDAAFQAGWMKDHARRFRLRSLMWEKIKEGQISIGDLVAHLDRLLDEDEALSQALLPEVWDVQRREGGSVTHANERRAYLRIQVLLEVTMRKRQRIGLEPWGRIRVDYGGLSPADPFIEERAAWIGISAQDLYEGVCTLLDLARRRQQVHDPEGGIFSRYWQDGDREIQRGYLPQLKGVPSGLKLRRAEGDDPTRLSQWISTRGSTAVEQAAKSWGIPSDHVDEFLEALWGRLCELQILKPVVLKGSKGRALPQCGGAHQVDADRLVLVPQAELWRCRQCRQAFARPTPMDRCPAWRCDGTLVREQEDPEDYDLSLLDGGFQMLRAREHSAQVPTEERDVLERMFKGDGEGVNTLVCTPTLELGVDIGGLDAVLMRNVPPLPANYWQRAGRAGRRHRMAVDITYARPASHDQFYFEDPLLLLGGDVEPPRFHLSNDIMVRKHVHATVLTTMNRLCRQESGLPDAEREEVCGTLRTVFPPMIRDYLFDESGAVRLQPFDVSPLATALSRHEETIVCQAKVIFQTGWPEDDREAVTDEKLADAVTGMADDLNDVIAALRKRLDWARGQIDRLNVIRRAQGTLDPENDALWSRCDRLIKRYKGDLLPHASDPEGYNDVYTYGVLAVEGFLPGYGLEAGSIRGTANLPRHIIGPKEFLLPRPPAMALREYVPGNLIYANAHRFVPRYFHLDRQTETGRPLLFQVDPSREVVLELAGKDATPGAAVSLAAGQLEAVPISDVDLAHFSHITDDEDFRFQMPVSIYGKELDRHGPGIACTWGGRDLLVRRNVHLRLVNVGPKSAVDQGALGYPVCLVCGHSVSPFASAAQADAFSQGHRERCGRAIKPVGFYADIYADALSLPGCIDREEAYSVLEALRVGATRVLDMERDDLEILVVGKPATEAVDAILYDPMPGGSGLLNQLCARWDEIVAAALNAVNDCQSGCERSCSECLCTFRNAYFHRYLDRMVAIERLSAWGGELSYSHDIPARLPAEPTTPGHMPVNEAEERLRGMLKQAGFPEPRWQHQLQLGHPLGSTTPDCFYEGDDDLAPGICIYLDGLSDQHHGDPETQKRDRQIRETLRASGFDVIEIPVHALHDREEMRKHFYRLGRLLLDKDRAKAIGSDTSWFG